MTLTFLQVAEYIETLDNIGKGTLIEYIKEHQVMVTHMKETEIAKENLKDLRTKMLQGVDLS